MTPPSSPNISKYSFDLVSTKNPEDVMELQLDYWQNDKVAIQIARNIANSFINPPFPLQLME